MQPYDWRAYLQRRVYDVAPEAPLEGITQGGYKLVYTAEPTKWWKSGEKNRKNTDLTYSGGFVVGNDGKMSSVLWDSPAFNAGMTIGDADPRRERPQLRRRRAQGGDQGRRRPAARRSSC